MPSVKSETLCWKYLPLLCGISVFFPMGAFANPMGGTVTAGSATITSTPTEVQINQTSSKVILDWNSFNIVSGETTRFNQPSAAAVALNRVSTSAHRSIINGNLVANGHVIVINPNGVLIGNGAHVDTAGFIASSADMANSAFMSATGTYDFNIKGQPNASVTNRGRITVKDEGLVALVAPTVRNQGIIEGNLAKVNLAAGDTFGVDLYGDGLLYVSMSPQTTKKKIAVQNTGSIIAKGGQVFLTAAAAGDMVNSVINNTGVIEATSIVNRNGEVFLMGAGADVSISGKINVSGESGGGKVTASGHDIAVSGTIDAASTVSGQGGTVTFTETQDASVNGVINVSGVNGGGSVNISGHDVTVGDTGNINAEATGTGQGGIVTLAARHDASVGGIVNANGVNGGGTVEVSAHDLAISEGGNIVAESTGTGQGGAITLSSTHIASLYGALSSSGINGAGSINVSSRDISVGNTADIAARAISSGAGGSISLSTINNTRIHGRMNADGVDSGGVLKVTAHKIFTDTAADLSLAKGTIDFNADTLIGFDAGKFNAENFNLDAPGVDFIGNINVTNTDLSLNTGTINLRGLILDDGGNAIVAPSRFNSNAAVVNVLADSASIQQGVNLAGNGAVVTVAGGSYFGHVTIDRSLTLQGDGSLPVLSAATAQSALVNINAEDVTVAGLSLNGNGSTAGIRLAGHDNISILNNNIINSGTGLDASAFGNGNIILAGNQFSNNAFGAHFGSGVVDLTGSANSFNGGNTALLFQPATSGTQVADLSIVDDTLGSTRFQGQTGLNAGRQYVDFEDGAFFSPGNPTRIDGTQAVFDGIQGSALTAGQLSVVQDRIHDFNDDATLGLIFTSQDNIGSINPTAAFSQIAPLGRPIISVADKVINYYPPFQPVETRVLDVNVSIKLPTVDGSTLNTTALSGIMPAAGGGKGYSVASELANIEPAAGGGVGSDIACANAFLDNKPCTAQ